ncbi:MAG: hypothetical protein FJ316_08645 [SAR202 cluster bacterium]|nr:hypothetical protein [SAR202 cluster bacterium]
MVARLRGHRPARRPGRRYQRHFVKLGGCGEYRIICSIFDTERQVDIVAVRHRSDAYR